MTTFTVSYFFRIDVPVRFRPHRFQVMNHTGRPRAGESLGVHPVGIGRLASFRRRQKDTWIANRSNRRGVSLANHLRLSCFITLGTPK